MPTGSGASVMLALTEGCQAHTGVVRGIAVVRKSA